VSIEIKTTVIQPKRHTFKHIAKRYGEDRPASRYDEGTYELQAEEHFHYRPLWEPEMQIFDKRRSAVTMEDWYALKDPRQYYYANYNITRAKQLEGVEHNFDMVEKRGMIDAIDPELLTKIKYYLLPLRHYEWGANMNNCTVNVYGWGAALTSACSFAMGDRLGIAQLISRVGLILDENREDGLNDAKANWMDDPKWQKMRHMVEDSLVVHDFFEVFVAQNLAMDGVIHPIIYNALSREFEKHGATAITFLTSFVNDWMEENNRWVDAVIKTACAENANNKKLISGWFETWSDRAFEAITPIIQNVLGDARSAAILADARTALLTRATKLGLAKPGLAKPGLE
jgi:phenol/toluene 2-monooxygenase (NADH) P1/A1